MKLSLATIWPPIGLLCLCSCTVIIFVGDVVTSGASSSEDAGSDTPGDSTEPTTSDGPGSVSQWTSGSASTDDDATTDTTHGPLPDLGTGDTDGYCDAPAVDCDADSQTPGHALGVDCEGGITAIGGLKFNGAPDSRKVVGQLGGDGTYKPTLGSRAVLLSTGIADHVEMTQEDLVLNTECSQIGLPCPATDFPAAYDLNELPAPMLTMPIICPMGQVPPGPGDCSQTIEDQWYGDPRIAHDYTELRITAKVPPGTLAIELTAAFFTAERPLRSRTGTFNDFFVVWLESELWTGNIAVHPLQGVAMTVNELVFDHLDLDPALAGFGFAEHAATDWVTLSAPVQEGETITLVAALFDANDGEVDSAVLLDDLHWACADPARGPEHP